MPDKPTIGGRLKQAEIRGYRLGLLREQQCKCALCNEQLTEEDAVLDHDHKSGRIRGAIHRSCNALLGKIENNYRRCGISNLGAFLGGIIQYISRQQYEVFHPSYRTEDEKRIRRNKRAKRTRKKANAERAAKKASS